MFGQLIFFLRCYGQPYIYHTVFPLGILLVTLRKVCQKYYFPRAPHICPPTFLTHVHIPLTWLPFITYFRVIIWLLNFPHDLCLIILPSPFEKYPPFRSGINATKLTQERTTHQCVFFTRHSSYTCTRSIYALLSTFLTKCWYNFNIAPPLTTPQG